MFSVEARDLSKCAFSDAVSTITICHFLISKINAFFRLSSLHFIADFCITNGAKKALKIPLTKCRYLQLWCFHLQFCETIPHFSCGTAVRRTDTVAEPFRFLEFLDHSNAHFFVPLWVTESCTEMKAEGALESCDFGLPKIASVPPCL